MIANLEVSVDSGKRPRSARRKRLASTRTPGTKHDSEEGRVFPFDALPPLAELLKRQRAQTTALERERAIIVPWVFHRNGRPIHYYYNAWRAACTKAGCPGRYVHDLRRTAVRNLERAGVPRSVAMKLTGHKTESVYRRYAIVAEGDLREGVAKLATSRALPMQSYRR